MYRTGDPRFRRRLDELGATLENANIQAQSGLYDFSQHYLKPCLASVTSCLTTCVEASCPSLKITPNQRERIRRQQRLGRSNRGRAEANFDFYDDWDEDENDALMGWGSNDEFDRLLAGGTGYGTLGGGGNAQPARQRGMSYPKARRKSTVDAERDPTVIPGSKSLFGKLFGGKAHRYKPSAAGMQDNPGATTRKPGQDITEGEALLREGGVAKKHRRTRSGTVASGHTTDSLSSRGDIFPSDEEDDAIPLDDEFAMVLERRTAGLDTESSSNRTRSNTEQSRRGKRPSTGSRRSTLSSRRLQLTTSNNSITQSPVEERTPETMSVSEGKVDEREGFVLQDQPQSAQSQVALEDLSSKEAAPHVQTPVLEPVQRHDEPSAMTTPLATTDDEADDRNTTTKQDEASQS